MNTLKLRLTGVAPLVMHNTQLADPRYKRSSGIGAITSKRQKTEADEMDLMKLEWLAGLYWGKNGPYIPGQNFDACLSLAASQLMKGGKKTVQSCVASEDAPLDYGKTYKTPEKLFADPEHLLYVPAVMPSTKARIMRARPVFPKWSAVVTVNYHSLTEEQVVQFAERAGDYIGLCDWRPRHGRFSVEKI